MITCPPPRFSSGTGGLKTEVEKLHYWPLWLLILVLLFLPNLPRAPATRKQIYQRSNQAGALQPPRGDLPRATPRGCAGPGRDLSGQQPVSDAPVRWPPQSDITHRVIQEALTCPAGPRCAAVAAFARTAKFGVTGFVQN